MSGILGTAQAGLQRATLGVQAVASNIARLNTAPDQPESAQTSDANLVNELVDLKRHEHAFSASATLIDFEDRRLGELLDLLA